MNYTAQSRAPSAGALLGALAIPAGIGALLVIGLVVTGPMPKLDTPLIGVNITPVPIDPPPPPPRPVDPQPTQKTAPAPSPASNPLTPQSPVVLTPGPVITLDPVTAPGYEVITLPPMDGVGAGPQAAPRLPDPIAATPRSNPGGWITEADYRTRWINEELSGIARFTLEIDARGRVTDCTITGSTGHALLDSATCRLLERRARFNPARDGSGKPVRGRYSSSVAWELP